jgi:hypothetical protein
MTAVHAPPPLAARDQDFSIALGGPLFQLLKHARLDDDALRMVQGRIALAIAITWLPLLAMTVANGTLLNPALSISFAKDVECHVRFLAAVPLLIVSELIVHHRLQPLVAQFRARQLVGPDQLPRLIDAIEDSYRLRNSVVAEIVLLAVVYVTSYLGGAHRYLSTYSNTWADHPTVGFVQASDAGLWLVFVSLPIFQFLLFRWYYRLAIWGIFLFRVSRLDLKLDALHPDKAGGIGFLSGSLNAFVTLAIAQGALLSGYMANRVLYAGSKLPDFKWEVAAAVVILLALFSGPLTLFAPKLAAAKREGLREYGRVAQDYVRTFRSKWIDGHAPAEEPLVGSGDIQSLADLSNSYSVAEQMRLFPISRAGIFQFVLAILLPIAPLLFTVMPAEQVLKTLSKLIL